MHISTLHLDELLIGLDPEADPALYAIAQTLKNLAEAASETDSRLDGLEERIADLE